MTASLVLLGGSIPSVTIESKNIWDRIGFKLFLSVSAKYFPLMQCQCICSWICLGIAWFKISCPGHAISVSEIVFDISVDLLYDSIKSVIEVILERGQERSSWLLKV